MTNDHNDRGVGGGWKVDGEGWKVEGEGWKVEG